MKAKRHLILKGNCMIGHYFQPYIVPALMILFVLMAMIKILSHIPATSDTTKEYVRKTLHVSMGSICLSFPWLFQSGLVVSLLAFLSTSILWIIRYCKGFALGKMKSVVCSDSRKSYGELYFPAAIALTFAVSGGEPVLYIVPIAILTFADASSALFGIRWGKHPFKYLPFKKSYEGSLAFFFVSFIVSVLGLAALGDMDTRHIFMVSAVVTAVTTLIEAACPEGLDNLMIPLGALFILKTHSLLSVEDLAIRLVVLTTLPFLLLLNQRRLNLQSESL
ncbi:MAG: hypothetical protein SFY67_04765 [Candidatus Melainabacteria bacterium]|nr:hypothetical protein [Candidatus Melainabacteria bacterium]